MKNKNLLLKLVTCILLIPCLIIPFVSMFASKSIAGNTTTMTGEYGIFADYTKLSDAFSAPGYNKQLATFWMVLVSILVIALTILALAYIVMFIMELCKAKCKMLPKLNKIVSLSILAFSVLALISAIVAVCVNTVTGSVLGTTLKLVFDSGSWLLIAPVFAGIVSLLALRECKKSARKKK